MRASETTGKLAEALAKAQGKLTDPPARGTNPHFNSRFARLQDALPLIRAALSSNGLSYVQAVDVERRALVTRLSHSSGEWLEADYPVQLDNSPQKQGSSVTYARRYSLFALLGLAADEDDDGNAASQPRPTQQAQDTERGHDPSWPGHQAKFCARLKELGHDYKAIASWTEAQGWGRPSGWSRDDREKLLHDLETGEVTP